NKPPATSVRARANAGYLRAHWVTHEPTGNRLCRVSTRSLATSSSRVDRPTTATNSTASLGAGSSMPPPRRQPEPTTDQEQDGGGSQRRLPAGRVVSAPHVEGDRPDAARQRHYLDDQQSEHLEQERQQERLDHERVTPPSIILRWDGTRPRAAPHMLW